MMNFTRNANSLVSFPNIKTLLSAPARFYRTTANPHFYNLRFRPSQGNDGNSIPYEAKFLGANGNDQTRTNRDPTKFKYSANLFNLDYFEWRSRGADYVYQIFKRLHRNNDAWTKCLLAYTGFSFMMMNQALIWKIHFFFFSLFTVTRIRDRGFEPTLDEVWLFDTLLKNEKIHSLFTSKTWHVIDYHQEYDEGLDNAYFPEYKTTIAKFFNTDCNTTSGFYKFGDVESGAMMTINFRTMPYANNKYNLSEPFYIYDMVAEITHEGEYTKEVIIKPEDVFKTK